MKTAIKDDRKTSLLDMAIDTESAIETNTEANTENISVIDNNYLINAIDSCIKDYEIENSVDITDIKQLQFNHVLETICNRIIKPLRIDFKDIDSLYRIADIYISLCRKYNKTSSLYGYSIISNIPYCMLTNNTSNNRYTVYIDIDNNYRIIDSIGINLYRMKHRNNNIIELSNSDYIMLTKKILADREHALTDKTEDGSVMALALGKIEYTWIESAKEKIQVNIMEKYQLPSDLIDKYSDD